MDPEIEARLAQLEAEEEVRSRFILESCNCHDMMKLID